MQEWLADAIHRWRDAQMQARQTQDRFAALPLRPCPFCRGTALTTCLVTLGHGHFEQAVSCGDCRAQGPSALTEVEAKQQWNRTADETAN